MYTHSLGYRALGHRALGLRALGLRALGHGALGHRALGHRALGLRALGRGITSGLSLGRPSSLIIHISLMTGWPNLAELMCTKVSNTIVSIFQMKQYTWTCITPDVSISNLIVSPIQMYMYSTTCLFMNLSNQNTCLIRTVQGRHLAVLIRQVVLYLGGGGGVLWFSCRYATTTSTDISSFLR